jgi:prolyl-tRNA synthetase
MRGIPDRVAIGPKDIEKGSAEVVRRDTFKNNRGTGSAGRNSYALLDDIQQNLYKRALKFTENNTVKVDSYDEFKKVIFEKGGFCYGALGWNTETEALIKEETKATIRCIST